MSVNGGIKIIVTQNNLTVKEAYEPSDTSSLRCQKVLKVKWNIFRWAKHQRHRLDREDWNPSSRTTVTLPSESLAGITGMSFSSRTRLYPCLLLHSSVASSNSNLLRFLLTIPAMHIRKYEQGSVLRNIHHYGQVLAWEQGQASKTCHCLGLINDFRPLLL